MDIDRNYLVAGNHAIADMSVLEVDGVAENFHLVVYGLRLRFAVERLLKIVVELVHAYMVGVVAGRGAADSEDSH